MSLRKKAKCLLSRVLVALGLKSASSCKAGPLPTTVEAPKKAKKKASKKSKES